MSEGNPGHSAGSRAHDRFRSAAAFVTVIALAAVAPRAHAIDRGKFLPLHRAAKAMEAAATGDVSYDRFSELARSFAEELVAAKGRVETDEEDALLLLYAQAGLAYGDSLAFLGQRIRYERPDVPSQAPEIAPLVARYAISTKGDEVDVNSAVAVIWAAAEEALGKAEMLYAGRGEELAAQMGAESRAEEHRRELIDRVASEFAREKTERPRPFEIETGNWTCPRGYVVRRGECLSDDEIAHLPKVEVSE